jgi:hypothetical protein
MKCVGALFMSEVNEAKLQKREIKQLNVWQNFLASNFLEYPGLCQLVQIMLCTSGNTSPLERGYTHLEMVAAKRRNRLKPENLEVLFLLAALKIVPKTADKYSKEVQRLIK